MPPPLGHLSLALGCPRPPFSFWPICTALSPVLQGSRGGHQAGSWGGGSLSCCLALYRSCSAGGCPLLPPPSAGTSPLAAVRLQAGRAQGLQGPCWTSGQAWGQWLPLLPGSLPSPQPPSRGGLGQVGGQYTGPCLEPRGSPFLPTKHRLPAVPLCPEQQPAAEAAEAARAALTLTLPAPPPPPGARLLPGLGAAPLLVSGGRGCSHAWGLAHPLPRRTDPLPSGAGNHTFSLSPDACHASAPGPPVPRPPACI